MARKATIKSLLKGAQRWVPLGLWRHLTRRTHIAFVYHLVANQTAPHVRWLLPHKTPRQFARDVEYLCREHRMLADENFDTRRPSSRPPVLITFDDGFTECYTTVRPILNRYGVRAFFFIITDCIDNRAMMYRNKASLCIERVATAPSSEQAELLAASRRILGDRLDNEAAFKSRVVAFSTKAPVVDDLCESLGVDVAGYLAERTPYLSQDQIRQLAEDGHVIGAHGVSHPPLWTLEPDEVESQIVESCTTISRLTGRERIPFAAPYGLEGVDLSLLFRIVRENTQVGQIFGTSGVLQTPPGILNRIGGDSPQGAGEDGTNLPCLLREAYMFNARQRMIRPIKRLLW